jgi:hypothetical protein
MALPSNVDYGTVTGRFLLAYADSDDEGLHPDGVPAKGYVIFTASPDKILNAGASPDPVTILPASVIANLDEDGYIEGYAGDRGVRLVATDDEDLNPVGWTWRVDFRLTDEADVPYPVASFNISLPKDTEVDLAVASPVPSANGTFYLVGPQGPTGPANTLSVSATTGAPGSEVSATISGTSPNQSIAFVIPRGEQGEQGEQGIQGIQGIQGDDALWTYLGAYNSGVAYNEGDVVTYLGSSYYRTQTAASGFAPTDPTYWSLVAAKGDQGVQGIQGPEGPQGPVGSSISIKGSVDEVTDLPSTGNELNDAYIVKDDGHLYVWDGTEWVDAGNIQGPAGQGVPIGGNAGDILIKLTSDDYDTAWSNVIDGGNA